MSKTLAKVAVIAGAIALVATTAGAAAGALAPGLAGTASVAGVSTATLATVAQVATVVAAAASVGAQLTAKQPGLGGAVNQVTIAANGALPYGVGRSFYAGSQIHDVGYGGKVGKTTNPYLSKAFIWSAGGPIAGVDQFLVDWQAVSFSGASALGYYATWLYARHQLGQRPEASALTGPWGAIPDWSALHKLSGYCASMLSFRFDRDNKVWANGIPTFGLVARWARVYDPRLDDTYAGGEGANRFEDEDSFAFDRNAALNAITYARGRYAIDPATREQTFKVIGCGFPKEAFDWPQWVAFANVCEANGWNSDGTLFDGPGLSLWDNLKRICAAGGGIPVISGGLLSVRFQSPKVALDTITAADFAEGERVAPGMRSWKDRINTIVPRFRSEANKWEYVQSAAVSFESYIAMDGEPKEEEWLGELVTDKDQGAQLAAYELMQRRELGGISYPLKPRFWYMRLGEAYHLTDAEAGLDHLCVVAGINKDIGTATVTVTLETETTEKHAAALGMTGTAPPPPTLVAPGEADDASWENGGKTVDPVTDLTAMPGAGSAAITYKNPTSSNFSASFIYRGTTNNFTAAVQVAGPIGGALGQTMQVTDSAAPGNYYWWVQSADTDGSFAEPTGPVFASVYATLVDGGDITLGDPVGGLYTITKSGSVAGFNASAVSTTGIAGGAVVEVHAPSGTGSIVVGLNSAPNAQDGWTDMTASLYFEAGGAVYAIESGTLTYIASWVAGDIFWIAQASNGSSVNYRKGATLTGSALLRTISTTPATLFFDSSIDPVGQSFIAGMRKA